MGCIPWADESMIRVYPQRETAHRQVTPFPTERHDTPNVALPAVYITHHPEGTPLPIVRAFDCVSSGGLSLRVAADSEAANVESEGPKRVRRAFLETNKPREHHGTSNPPLHRLHFKALRKALQRRQNL